MSFLQIRNAKPFKAGEVPVVRFDEFRQGIISATSAGGRLVSFFGSPLDECRIRLYAVISGGTINGLGILSTDVENEYPALTPDCPQAHWFEREIAEQWGVVAAGHPWLKPIRFHSPYRGATAEPAIPGVTDYYRVEGEEVHEVAVGPVHAGIIEPGHFRFQCHGENVFHLEISLGYQHRGVEKAMRGGPDKRSMHYAETLAGDTTIGHGLAYAQALEALAGCAVPERAQQLRAIALELERIANHVGDLGALAGDIGYLPTASYCGRLRGDVLNLSALVCGSRFGRGWVRPGGVAFDVDAERASNLTTRLRQAFKDIKGAVSLLWTTSSVQARFEETGAVSLDDCNSLGLVGPAARACGAVRDVRHEFPIGGWNPIPVSTRPEGDVYARAYIRWLEIEKSTQFILGGIQKLADGPSMIEMKPLAPNCAVVSLTEGWRGEICHAAFTGADGKFEAYKVVDPSFHNWMGLAIALRNQQISDFPLCNKSFNLSYCGHDL